MRREDYAPRKTPDESPFRNFHIRCLRCESYKLQLAVHYDETEGAEILIILCQQCCQAEKVVV
ncbi:MAG: hypothetical protein ABIR24_07805 [Verrucomicrobiota bacterium]